MPAVTRLGDICTGHDICSPRENDEASPNVFTNNIQTHRQGDHWVTHCTHDSFLEIGSENVFVNFKQIARIGDPIECGSAVAEGSPNVFANEGGQAQSIIAPPSVPAVFTVPPVIINPQLQAAVNQQTANYIANPSAYSQNPSVINDQVKRNYPGTPEEITVDGTGGGGGGGGGPTTVGPSAPAGTSLIDPSASGDIYNFLTRVLQEANRGVWDETGMGGKPSNPTILNVWKELGFPQTGAWLSDQTAWCMGFVNYVLKNTGYRFVQTARARDINDRRPDYKAISVPLSEGQVGDICLWSYSHVNFIYSVSGGSYTFVGGNQSNQSKNANNPSGGSVTRSWPSGYKTPGNGSLVAIFRPVKS